MFYQFRLLLSGIFIFVFTSALHSQTVEWSNQAKVKTKTGYTQVIGENNSGVYLVRCRNNEFRRDIIVEKYRSNLALELSIELMMPTNCVMEKLVLFEGNLLFFYSGKNTRSGKIELNCVSLDLTFKPVGNPVMVCEVEFNDFKDNSNFYIKVSGDKTKLAVMYIRNSREKNQSVISILGLSDQLVTIYKKEVPVDYEVSDVFFSSMECNNDGDVFGVIDFPKSMKKNRTTDPRNFFLYAYYFDSDKIVKYELGKDSVFINELGIAINNFSRTVCVTGFYSFKPDNRVSGEFLYRIDFNSHEVKLKSFENFPKNFIAKVAGSMQNEGGPMISDLYIRKIIPRSDGGCLTVAEKYYETKQAYTFYVNGFPQTSYRVVYNFDEIIIVSKNADGTTQFREFIKKNQSSLGDLGYYSSFVTVSGTDKIGFVYNSDVNNEGDVMISTVSNKGVTDTKVLIKALSYFVQLMPGESKQVSSNSSLICSLKDKRFSIMRLIF